MNWIDGKQIPLDDSDCLVIYETEEEDGKHRALRAPVFWWEEKQQWVDEWGNNLNVVKYCLIPELDDGTTYK